MGKQAVRLRKEVPGHVANRLQAAFAREVYYLVAEGVVSAADVDTALCWGPGLRWGIMGNMMLNHLGGGQGGIEHFFEQFTGPMTAWWKVLGQPVLTPEVQKKLIDSVHAEVGSRSISELEAERDDILLGLLELRRKYEKPVASSQTAARARRLSMTFPNLHDVQQLMLRAYVRNVMFFATLPFYLAQEMRPVPERSRRAGQTSSAPRDGRALAGGRGRQPGSEDIRWLR